MKIRSLNCLQMVRGREEELLLQVLNTIVPKHPKQQLTRSGNFGTTYGEAAQNCLERGMRLVSNGRMPSLGVFQELMHAYPNGLNPSSKQPQFYFSRQSGTSLRLCRKVLDVNPNHFGAWHTVAMCALQLGEVDIATEAIEQFLTIYPRSPTS